MGAQDWPRGQILSHSHLWNSLSAPRHAGATTSGTDAAHALRRTLCMSTTAGPVVAPNPATTHAPRLAPQTPSFWLWVLCLLGVDYFSTLAYQPTTTFEVAGRLGPFATLGVVP